MEVKVLGSGCYRCLRLEMLVMDVLREVDPQATLERVGDPRLMARYLIGEPPGLVINEKLVCAGRIPTKAETRQWLTSAMAEPEA